MKRILALFFFAALMLPLAGCGSSPCADIAATTLPVAEFTQRLCQGTGLTVTRLVTEPVSCLHDYTLNVRQVKAAEAAKTIVISGAGLEDFLEGVIDEEKVIDASAGISLICPEEHEEEHEDLHHPEEHEGHHHEQDPHIWLSPANACIMAENICAGLSDRYPQKADVFAENLAPLLAELDALQSYGEAALCDLSCRELITFHDGFSYFAESFGLTILAAVEEESGSEASARELIGLIGLTREHNLPAIFIEVNGSPSAASVLSRETRAAVCSLDMAMAGDSYFDAMYGNIHSIKEALG